MCAQVVCLDDPDMDDPYMDDPYMDDPDMDEVMMRWWGGVVGMVAVGGRIQKN